MNLEQFTREDDYVVGRYDYGDERVLAIDFGAGSEAAVDVVDDTVIVVFEDGQHELDLPEAATDAHTFIQNGVLTIEMEADR